MKKRHIAIADLEISQKAKKYINQVLSSNRLSYGRFTEQFEKEFAKIHKRKFASVTNSGTSGLQIALHALKETLGWDDGDEILVPAVTFIASSNVVLHNNLKPVFVDVEPDFYCIDPAKIEEKITSRTRAIMPVHLFGQSADMKPILAIARKYSLKIVEDSCEAMFVKYHNEPVGSLGDVSVFSTYIAHIIVTGVGGIVTTNDESLAIAMKSLMFHGRDNIYLKIEDDDNINSRVKLNSLIERRFQFEHVGYSYRLTELEGALGLAELKRRKEIIKRRQWVGRRLTEVLNGFSDFFQFPKVRPDSDNIETRLFMPLLSQPIYKKIFGDIESLYPIARELVSRGFIIGSHPYLSENDIKYVQNSFQTFLKNEGLLA